MLVWGNKSISKQGLGIKLGRGVFHKDDKRICHLVWWLEGALTLFTIMAKLRPQVIYICKCGLLHSKFIPHLNSEISDLDINGGA